MGCTEREGCSSTGCGGCCKSGGTNGFEAGISSIVELEIHYSQIEGKEEAAYVLESLICLTNIQTKGTQVTGLEGRKFDGLDKMRQLVIDSLLGTDGFTCGSLGNIDISYIKDDI